MAVVGITACGKENASQVLSSLEYEQGLETTEHNKNETKENGLFEADNPIEATLEVPAENLENNKEQYFLYASDGKNDNAVFCINGYLYNFCLDISQMYLEVGSPEEERRYYGNVKVQPVYATDGVKKVQLGVIRGAQFDIRSDYHVSPSVSDGNKLCGRIEIVNENEALVYFAKEIDKDTYSEFIDVAESGSHFKLMGNAEFIVLDSNHIYTQVTFERFIEHLERDSNKVYYVYEKEGKIVQIWEPYIP